MSVAAMYDPPNSQALAVLGIMAMNEGDFQKANNCAEQILLLGEDHIFSREKIRRKIMGHFLKGSVLWLQKNKKDALLEFEKVESLTGKIKEPVKKSYSRMFSMMSDCYRSSGNHEKAEKCYEKIFETMTSEGRGDSSDYWFFKGNEFFIAGKYDDAVNAYRKALEKDPGNKMIQFNLKQSELKASESSPLKSR
jgi:tetratricopeptide (TPR) repeat protein